MLNSGSGERRPPISEARPGEAIVSARRVAADPEIARPPGWTPTGPIRTAPSAEARKRAESRGRRPVFDHHFGHREIVHIGRREGRADASRGGSDQAVRLVKCHAAFSELTAPCSRSDALSQAKRSEPQAVEEAAYRRLLRGAQPPPDLLQRDHTDPRFGPCPTQSDDPFRHGFAPKCIDQNGRIEYQSAHVSRRDANHRDVASGPRLQDPCPNRARSRRAPQRSLRCHPSAVRRPARA
jgi:hypothetical protein